MPQQATKVLLSSFPLRINRDLTLAEMIRACHYVGAHPAITAEHFPVSGTGTAELEAILVHFDRVMSHDVVLAEFDRMGLRLGDLPELLAFDQQHSDGEVPRHFPIVECASVWAPRDGNRHVAYIYEHAGGRYLNLNWVERGWNDDDRFLAFRKS